MKRTAMMAPTPKPRDVDEIEREMKEMRALVRTAGHAVTKLAKKSGVSFIGRARDRDRSEE